MSLSTSPVQRTSQLVTHHTSHSSSNKSHGSAVQWVSDETDDRHVKINGLSPPSSPSRPLTPGLLTTSTANLLPITHSHSISSAPSSTIMHTSPSSTHDRTSLSKEDMKKSNDSIINISSTQQTPIKITTPLVTSQPSPSPSPSPSPDATLLSHPTFRTFTSTNGHTKTTTMTPSTTEPHITHKDASVSSLGLTDDSIPSLQLDTPQSPQITTQHITPIEMETIIKPSWTLLFTDMKLETQFQTVFFTFNKISLIHLMISVITLIIVGIYRDIQRYGDNHDIYGKRLGYICTSAILMCIVVGMIYLRSMTQRVPSIFITLLYTLAGCFWAVGGAIGNDTAMLPTQSMYLMYFLLIGHIIGHMFLFIHITISSCIICVVYVITSFLYHYGNEPITDPAINITILLLCTILLCIHTYQYERNQRYTYQLNIQSMMDRQRLKKEATELREEVYALVLEKYDIADVETNIDLKSPLEKAMVLLQMMEREKTLSKENFTRVKQVIELLGTSSDIFKPKVEQVLRGERNALDDDTTKWLISLVEDEGHHNTDSLSPERKLVAIDGSLQSQTTSSGLRGIPGATSSDISVSLASEEELTFSKIQSQLDEWNFDVFEVARLTKGRPLFYMCMTLFRKFNFIQKFNLDKDKLCNYLNTIESGYHSDKPYHNSTHAADVTRTVNFFLARGGLKNYCTDLEMMAAIVASAVHDFDHPGVGNNFLVRLRDEKAILYNDKSVLENHHVATAFKQMLKPENNFLSNLTTKQFDEFRKIMIEMVLATDLSHHFEFVGHFKAAMSKIDTTTDQSRLMILKMSLKCADVGHAAKAVSLHVKWTQRVIEEFYRQGDEERKANIPISPFMDRRKANVPKAQVGFIDFLVYPMYDSFSTFLNLPPTVIPCLAELQNNREYWKKLST